MLKKLVSSKFFIPWQQWTQQKTHAGHRASASSVRQKIRSRQVLPDIGSSTEAQRKGHGWGLQTEAKKTKHSRLKTDQADFHSKMTSSNISTGLAETSRTLVHPYSSLKPSDSAMHENTKTCVWINWCKSSELKNGNFKYLAQKALCSPEGVQQWSKLATPFQVWWGSFATAVRDAVNTEIKWCTMCSSHLRNKQHHREIK